MVTGFSGYCALAWNETASKAASRIRMMFPPAADATLGCLLLGALLDWLRFLAQVHRGIDQRDVREGLREVAQLAAAARVGFLGEQADVVGEAAQALEQLARLGAPAEQDQAVGEPEAAGEEHPLALGQPVERFARAIAQHEAVLRELALDRLDGAAHARVAAGQKARHRDEEQARIERARAVALHEAAALLAPRVLADIGVDLPAHLAPMLDRALASMVLHRLDRAVEGDPAHDLRIGEVARPAANLPQAHVRVPPAGLEVLEQRALHVPR